MHLFTGVGLILALGVLTSGALIAALGRPARRAASEESSDPAR